MGWSFRKSFRIAPGVRLNLSKRGLGWSVGGQGLRIGFGGGRTRVSTGIGPLRYQKSARTGGGGGSAIGLGCLGILGLLFVVGVIGSLVDNKKPKSSSAPGPKIG